jgi:hypothetical protein
MTDPVALDPVQIEVASVFFGLPESDGFLLAGGAGLAAQRMTSRPTEDLDLFTGPGQGDVGQAANAFERAAAERGWVTTRERDGAQFIRLDVVVGAARTRVDLAVDAAPGRPGRVSVAGPTRDPLELAGRKVVALFDRALDRDFVDVYFLAGRFSREQLLALAGEVDQGFDPHVFVEMLQSLGRYTDDELPLSSEEAPALRAFYADWSRDLVASFRSSET